MVTPELGQQMRVLQRLRVRGATLVVLHVRGRLYLCVRGSRGREERDILGHTDHFPHFPIYGNSHDRLLNIKKASCSQRLLGWGWYSSSSCYHGESLLVSGAELGGGKTNGAAGAGINSILSCAPVVMITVGGAACF